MAIEHGDLVEWTDKRGRRREGFVHELDGDVAIVGREMVEVPVSDLRVIDQEAE